MNRHLFSLLVTALIYIGAGATFFYFFETQELKSISPHAESSLHLCVTLVQLQSSKKEPQKQQTQKKLQQKAMPTQRVDKYKTATKLQPKLKKSVLAQKELPLTQKNKMKKQATKKELSKKEEQTREIKTPQSVQTTIAQQESASKRSQMIYEKELKRREFITQLLEKINSNKSYPSTARRRALEGEVDVKFTLLSDGNVENIEIISGKSIFKNATKQAIEKSFPIKVDYSLFDFPEAFQLKVIYSLKQS